MAILKINKPFLFFRTIFAIAACTGHASAEAFGTEISNVLQYTKSYDKCVDSANGITITLRKCANADLQRRDIRLNRLYKKLLNDTEHSGRKKLKADQLAWIQFRDRQCEYEATLEQQGTMWPLLTASCHIDFPIRRADEIEGRISQRSIPCDCKRRMQLL